MPSVTMPDGAVVDMPEKLDPAMATRLRAFQSKGAGPAKEAAPSWSDVPGQALKNAPGGLVNLAKGTYEAVRHPIDTAKNLVETGVGELLRATPGGEFQKKNPERAKQLEEKAGGVNQFYADRYGSEEGFKRALATDPVGVVSDLSVILGGAESLPGRVGEIAGTASRATNPIAAAKVAGPLAKSAGWIGKKYAGMRTGVGSEAFTEAVKEGEKGGTAVARNLRGQANLEDVLKDADDNLQAMMQRKNAEYGANMSSLQGNKTVDPASIHRIRTTLDQQQSGNKFAGLKKSKRVGQALGEVEGLVRKQLKTRNPDALTPLGLDQLKQRIGELLDKYDGSPQARRAVQQVYDTVKAEIVRAAPEYAEAMDQYREARQQIKDIQQALSLPGAGGRFSKDTALRKLQSVMRNNVQTNYGERMALAKALEKAGGRPLLPALAGQALSSWEPRGINRLIASGEMGAALGLRNLLPLLDLPAQSPRLMGEAALALGKAKRYVNPAYTAATSNQALARALLAGKAGGLYDLPQPDETGAVR